MASLSDSSSTTNSSALPSYSGSVVTLTPRQAYRRVQRVVELQWRGIAIVIIIIIDVIFFAVVFVVMDNNQIKAANVSLVSVTDTEPVSPSVDWLLCLVKYNGDKTLCLDKSADLIMNQATITAVLVLLSVSLLLLLAIVKCSVDNPSATAFGYCFSCRAFQFTRAGTTWSSQKPSLVGSL